MRAMEAQEERGEGSIAGEETDGIKGNTADGAEGKPEAGIKRNIWDKTDYVGLPRAFHRQTKSIQPNARSADSAACASPKAPHGGLF